MWLLHRRKNEKREDPDKAIRDAQRHLSRIEDRDDQVDTVVNSLKKIRKDNHFAEAMEDIILQRREETT